MMTMNLSVSSDTPTWKYVLSVVLLTEVNLTLYSFTVVGVLPAELLWTKIDQSLRMSNLIEQLLTCVVLSYNTTPLSGGGI